MRIRKRTLVVLVVVLFVALGVGACRLDGNAADRVRTWSFESATDTILLDRTDTHVVASLTDLLEWHDQLVVMDRLEDNVKVYDTESGRLVRVIGRSGEGPGEFIEVVGAAVLADGSLAVLDTILARVTFFDAGGEDRKIWSVPGAFGTGIDAFPGGDVLMAGRLVADRMVISDSAVHRFTPEGESVRAYFTLPEPVHFGESSFNAMNAIIVDSTVIGLQHTTNVAVLHDLATGLARADTLGASFYRGIDWTLEPYASDSTVQAWMREQQIGWWLRGLGGDVYVAGYREWADSIGDWRIRWVFATPDAGPFAVSQPTDAHPAFIRDGRIHAVRIRDDGRTELIIGDAPLPGGCPAASPRYPVVSPSGSVRW